MGRRKIDIVRIENERHRQVTYTKRKAGLIKKATELAVLCDAQVGLIIFGANAKMSVYSSQPMNELVERYRDYHEAPEVRAALRRASEREALVTSLHRQRQCSEFFCRLSARDPPLR